MAQVLVEKDEMQQKWTREKQSMMTQYNESVEACVEAQQEVRLLHVERICCGEDSDVVCHLLSHFLGSPNPSLFLKLKAG